jgi:hypothetical protein
MELTHLTSLRDLDFSNLKYSEQLVVPVAWMAQVALDLMAEKLDTYLLNLKPYLARPLTSTLEQRVMKELPDETILVVDKVANHWSLASSLVVEAETQETLVPLAVAVAVEPQQF